MKKKSLYKVVTLLFTQLGSLVPLGRALATDPHSATSAPVTSDVEIKEVGAQSGPYQTVAIDPNVRSESAAGHNQPQAEFASYLKGAESIPVPPGRTVTIATQSRIARVYIANPSIVESYTV